MGELFECVLFTASLAKVSKIQIRSGGGQDGANHRQRNLINYFMSMFLFQYADPVADLLDKWDVFRSRLFRESCVFHKGNYVKDLSKLGRELHQIIIIDNSPASYIFHPENAVSRDNRETFEYRYSKY